MPVVKNHLINQSGNSAANSNICLSLRARIWLSETSTVTMSFLYLLPSVDVPIKSPKIGRVGGSGCAGCAAAHPIIAFFLSKDSNLVPKSWIFILICTPNV